MDLLACSVRIYAPIAYRYNLQTNKCMNKMDGNKKKNVHWDYDLLHIQLNPININVYFFPIYIEDLHERFIFDWYNVSNTISAIWASIRTPARNTLIFCHGSRAEMLVIFPLYFNLFKRCLMSAQKWRYSRKVYKNQVTLHDLLLLLHYVIQACQYHMQIDSLSI